ncbi:MAG: penicillin-binding protein [Actinomycetota bacterium]
MQQLAAPEYEPERSPLPRTWKELRARARDAARFGERTSPPIVMGSDLIHRATLLAAIAIVTALFLSVLTLPGVAVIGHAVGNLTNRFSTPIGQITLPEVAQRSVVLSKDGRVIATLAGPENRIVVPLRSIPVISQDAVIAIEDAKFYKHHGVDPAGFFRALLFNVRSGGSSIQGGSTITQQLIKNTLVGTERSIDRKIREARLAVRLEQTMSKHQILEAYLNDTYFGNGAYGIGAAAQFYFGEGAAKLTLAQSALLAGVIRAPEDYEPLRHANQAKARRNTVLQRMADLDYIAQKQADAAKRTALGAKAHPLPAATAPYFVEFVKQQILSDPRFGATAKERANALFQAGLRIQTTLDSSLQTEAARASAQVLNRSSDPSSALVSIDPTTGAVRAMVGGQDFDTSKFNLAVQGKRQPGSTFKPMTLMAALDAGLPPGLQFDTPSPLRIRDQTGKAVSIANYDHVGHGVIDMRRATELSINTYYVQLIQRVGPANVVAMAHKLGITSDLQPYLSLALGTEEVSPFELASAYATIANQGVYCKPFAITQVADASGKVLLQNTPNCNRVVPAVVAGTATNILEGVATRGTGATNGQIGRPAGEKTGTTDNYTDSWFAGFTPQFATVVWLGYKDSNKHPLYNIHGYAKVFGGSLPAMIWAKFMRFAHTGLPIERFPGAQPVKHVPVPNIVGQTVADARATLEKANFSVTIKIVKSSKPDGTVLAQDPAAATNVEEGAMITLAVSGTPAPAPSPQPSPSNTPATPSPTPSATKKQ